MSSATRDHGSFADAVGATAGTETRVTRHRQCARRRLGIGLTLLACMLPACVTTNLETGQPVPRGNQRYPYDEVSKRAERLRIGMSKVDVLLLLGSPAEKDENNNLWIYLPERYGILVPASALRLEFKEGNLVDFGSRPIILGARL